MRLDQEPVAATSGDASTSGARALGDGSSRVEEVMALIDDYTDHFHESCQPTPTFADVIVLRAKKDAIRAALAAPAVAEPNRACALILMSAAAKSGDPGAISLAAQLAGTPPCAECGFVKQHCQCAALRAAPEGWVSVPRVPTQAMCQAGQWKANEWPKFPLRISPIWQAMIAAAPSPTPEEARLADIRRVIDEHRDVLTALKDR